MKSKDLICHSKKKYVLVLGVMKLKRQLTFIAGIYCLFPIVSVQGQGTNPVDHATAVFSSDAYSFSWLHLGEGQVHEGVFAPPGSGSLMLGGALATGKNSLAIGDGAFTQGTSSLAFGRNTRAAGGGIAMGVGSSAEDWCIAIGTSSHSSTDGWGQNIAIGQSASAFRGSYSLALGTFARTTNVYGGIAIGTAAVAGNDYGTALGLSSSVGGKYGLALGVGSRAEQYSSLAISVGSNSSYGPIAGGANAASIGDETISVGEQSFVIGKYNDLGEGLSAEFSAPNYWRNINFGNNVHPEDHFFVIGNGISRSDAERSNALILTHGGHFLIPWQDVVAEPAPPAEGDSERKAEHAFEVRGDGTVVLGKVQGDISMGIFGE